MSFVNFCHIDKERQIAIETERYEEESQNLRSSVEERNGEIRQLKVNEMIYWSFHTYYFVYFIADLLCCLNLYCIQCCWFVVYASIPSF